LNASHPSVEVRPAKLPEVDTPWLGRRFHVPATTRHLRLGARSILFCERSQQLVELNSTAELIWQGLAGGSPPEAIAARLEAIGASADEAIGFVLDNLRELLEAGRLLPSNVLSDDRACGKADMRLRIGGLECALRLNMPGYDPLRRQLDDVFGHFAAEVRTTGLELFVHADGAGYFLIVGNVPWGMFAADRIIPEIKAVVTDRLARTAHGGSFLLHAALLASERKGLLLTGAPGAGKTTLTMALAARGMGEVSGGSRLSGIRFSPASKSGAWDLVAPYMPAVRHLATHVRADGQSVRYLPVGAFGAGDVDDLGWLLLLDRRPGARAVIEPVDPVEALTELLGGAFSASHHMAGDMLESFAAQISTARGGRLIYSDLTSAADLVEDMVAA
jgi:hypothetical protein